MRAEGNPLDLNNLPEEYGKQPLEESSTTTAASTENSSKGQKKKKREGKDESGKVYECRFCSLKFCKSQALGGHMNRHRQERETETLNRARQLVFSNDALAGAAGSHIGLRDLNMSFGGATAAQAIPSAGSFQGMGSDARLQFRPVYPRQLPTAPQAQQPHHLQSYLYSPSSCHGYPSSSSSYPATQPPPPPPPPPMNEYYIGRPQSPNYAACYGREVPMSNAVVDGRNWTCTHRYGHHPHDGL